MPPPIDAVIARVPALLAATVVPVAILTARSFKPDVINDGLSAEDVKEKLRRKQRVMEYVQILEGIQRIEDARTSTDDDDECTPIAVTFKSLGEQVQELAKLDSQAAELEAGLEWVGKLCLREVRIAVAATKKQTDPKYMDGSALYRMLRDNNVLLNGYDTLSSKYKIPPQIRHAIRAKERQGWKVRRSQMHTRIVKGVKVIMLAKNSLPWICASFLASGLKSYIAASAFIYRANVLDSLQCFVERKDVFKRNTFAMVLFEALAAMVGILDTQLKQVAMAGLGQSISVKMYEALMDKDLQWWREVPNPQEIMGKIAAIPYQAQQALSLPRQLIDRIVSVTTMFVELRKRGGPMLYILLGLQWLQMLVKFGIKRLNERLTLRLQARVPTRASNFKIPPFWEALRPDFVALYQSFAQGKKVVKLYKDHLTANHRHKEISSAIGSVMLPLTTLTEQASRVANYAAVGNLMANQQVPITEAQTLLDYARNASNTLQTGYNQLEQFEATVDPLAAAHDIILTSPKIDLSAGVVPRKRAVGHVKYDHVQFKYPGKIGDDLLLKGVSFEAMPGQVIGITGESGCGKSTCLRLMQRFYEVAGGSIFLDGKDIRSYNPRWLRSQIVAVDQEPKLLSLSIRENLAFGCDDEPSLEDIQKACEAARIWHIINDKLKFPEGLETMMSAVGNLAGGEKQRICIARAILANPSILLLDEATSALDEISQQHVQEALNELMKGRTTFVVAHRLSTLRNADKIIGMSDGLVIDDGTHEELLAKDDQEPNVWKKLWAVQEVGMDSKPQSVT
eukprot:TRINITY_DN28953_c0_g1_i1.p1 TRINITY_DN28953_c0_g1~~TRINITY_DN28953_c0_g1_i1.p1  ORF type:complete len:808 (+),score=93.36 TRINITY_DN28953_c0_g1_i1:43-2424(+)